MIAPDKWDSLIKKVSSGVSLRSILDEDGMPNRFDFYDELRVDPRRAEQYACAKEASAEAFADDILEIADQEPAMVHTEMGSHIDSAGVQHQRLRVDARKWIASKLKPKVYGDKYLAEVSGPGGTPIQVVTGVKDATIPLPLSGPGLGSVDAY